MNTARWLLLIPGRSPSNLTNGQMVLDIIGKTDNTTSYLTIITFCSDRGHTAVYHPDLQGIQL
jgi:hypothetical protein